MNTDRRFAIIIGVNDYEISPLKYCVNDALAVAKVLEEKCLFNKEDIFTITSDTSKPIKDISGHFDNAVRKIGSVAQPQKDSVFFYFAGHGEYLYANSGLQFQDSFVKISDIFARIDDLQPKYQCYIIDACESGGKVLTRGAVQTDLIEKFILKSSGILFMYATTETEQAKELERIEHGLFTYYFLEAVNDDSLYDEDGVLTPNRIQDYIARETSKGSQFKQTPVIENRSIGYYPFAFKSVKKDVLIDKKVTSQENLDEKRSLDKVYFPIVPAEIRKEISDDLKISLEGTFNQMKDDLSLDGYNLKVSNDLSVIGNYTIEDKITDSIVAKSKKENVEAVNVLFSSEKEENIPKPMLGTFSMINALTQHKDPLYTYYNRIEWSDDRLIAFCANMQSNEITKASCGLVVVIYQAVYGIGMAISSFYLDYTGYADTELNGPYTNIEAFKVHKETLTNIKVSIESHTQNFISKVQKWNADRQKKIVSFGNKAK